MPRTFEEAKTELANLRGDFLKGLPVKDRMNAVAKEAADLYNEKAKEVAKRMGVKPSLVTPDKLMRSCRVAGWKRS